MWLQCDLLGNSISCGKGQHYRRLREDHSLVSFHPFFYYVDKFMCSFPGGPGVKNLPANAGNTDSIPGSGRSPGEGNGDPHQPAAWQAIDLGVVKESDTN